MPVPKSPSPERSSPQRRSPTITVPADGTWKPLSPRSADRIFRSAAGRSAFGQKCTPGASPRASKRRQTDSRRRVLLNMTFANLTLAIVLLVLGAAGPRYPGHHGTTDNAYTDGQYRRLTTQESPLYAADCPSTEVDVANSSILHSALIVGLVIWLTQPCSARRISKQVDRAGAAATLLTSVVCACTCLGAFAIVMIDISYVAGCCSLLQDNCERSNLCTEYVDDCCISDQVDEYCQDSSYHVSAVSMIFLVFLSTSAMMIMACTMTCRCWLSSDPEKQAMMMVLSGGTATAGSLSLPGSPQFSPRATLLSALGNGTSPTAQRKSPKSTWTETALEDGRASASEQTPSTRETCPQCGAIFGDHATLTNHVLRFHPQGCSSPCGRWRNRNSQGRVTIGATGERVGARAPEGRSLEAKKRSEYTSDDAGSIRVTRHGRP